MQHEPERKLLRQRAGRELLCFLEERADRPTAIHIERGGTHRRVHLDRRLVQPKTQALGTRVSQSRAVRKTAKSVTRTNLTYPPLKRGRTIIHVPDDIVA